MAAVQKAKPAKDKKAATPSPHPPYLEMIKEAISALKDRTGSSQPAIAKFLEDRYKTHLPPNFRKMLSMQLRRFAKSEKLFKVKNSYKLSAPDKKAPTAGAFSAPAANKGPGRPPKKSVEAAKKKAVPTKPNVAKKAVADKKKATEANPKVSKKAVADKKKAAEANPKVAKKTVADKKKTAAPKKPLKTVKSPVGKKRSVKSIKSPKKGPVAKKARVSK